MKANIYQEVTDKIIAQLEQGIIPWHKPWTCSVTGGAFNRVSKKPYSFMNQMLLNHTGEYATFKQWSNLGGKVRKGEKAERVVFWKMFKVKDTDVNGKEIERTIPMLRHYSVFHISQVDGVNPLESAETFEHDPIAEAEAIIDAYRTRENITDKIQFVNCFSDDIAYFYLDVEPETKERIIKMKEGGEDERELLEVLVRR